MDQSYCPCWILAHPLERSAFLPDHICEDTARDTCSNWLHHVWPLPILGPIAELYQPTPATRGAFAGQLAVHVHLAEQVFANCTSPRDWPVPILEGRGELYAVIDQWAEDDPSERLASELDKNRDWQACLQVLRTQPHYVTVRSQSRPIHAAQTFLSRFGLPATPNTAEHLLYCLLGTPEAILPTRGIKVTSFCLRPNPGKFRESAQVVTSFSAGFPWATDELFRQARKRAQNHKEWWSRLSQTSMNNLRGRPPLEDELSYDTALHIDGSIDFATLSERECKREAARHGVPALSPIMKRQVENKIKARIRRMKKQIT